MAEGTYGKPLVFFQRTCDLLTSPLPPGVTAKALFFDSDMYLSISPNSSRVILPSWFRSLLSKKPLRNVFSDSSREMAPSPSASPCFKSSSKVGNLKSDSCGSPGDQPAK